MVAKGSAKKQIQILVGTRKGAFILSSNADRKKWELSDPIFLGHIVYHIQPDRRDGKTLLMAAKTGHLGPTLFRSEDRGATWTEASTPPAFSKSENGEDGKAVSSIFWLSQGPENERDVWYAGTTPPGLFRTTDGGKNWKPVSGFNDHANYKDWATGGETPGGQILHSINVDPRDSKHMYIGISVGGVFESLDQGANWAPLNQGCAADFMPDPEVEFGHDPHCVVMHPLKPDRLYQQNHCGIYVMDRPAKTWQRIGKNMPESVGDIGFPIVVHPRDPDCAWVFPMDGTTVWPRTSPDGKPATYITRDAGKSWKRQDKGLPDSNAYFTVKRQAMAADNCDSVGVYFGTSQGEVWGSTDEGQSWSCLTRYLPEIYSITVAEYE